MLGQHSNPLILHRTFGNFDLKSTPERGDALAKAGALIGGIGKEGLELGKGGLQGGQQAQPAIPILKIRRMDQGIEHEPLGIHQDLALLVLDALTRILARRVNPCPPFSADWML